MQFFPTSALSAWVEIFTFQANVKNEGAGKRVASRIIILCFMVQISAKSKNIEKQCWSARNQSNPIMYRRPQRSPRPQSHQPPCMLNLKSSLWRIINLLEKMGSFLTMYFKPPRYGMPHGLLIIGKSLRRIYPIPTTRVLDLVYQYLILNHPLLHNLKSSLRSH